MPCHNPREPDAWLRALDKSWQLQDGLSFLQCRELTVAPSAATDARRIVAVPSPHLSPNARVYRGEYLGLVRGPEADSLTAHGHDRSWQHYPQSIHGDKVI